MIHRYLRVFLIPVKLEECEIPDGLKRWHCANLFSERGYERLVESLKNRSAAFTPNRQLHRLLLMITARSQDNDTRLLLVTKNNLGWRTEASANPDRLVTAYLLPYLEDANFNDPGAAQDLAYALGVDTTAVEVTIDTMVFQSTKYNPVFKSATDYWFRFGQVRFVKPLVALQSSRPELSLRPYQFEWHSLESLIAHTPTRELNYDVLEAVVRRFGHDLHATSLSLQERVPTEPSVQE